jgi:hypothetical protein
MREGFISNRIISGNFKQSLRRFAGFRSACKSFRPGADRSSCSSRGSEFRRNTGFGHNLERAFVTGLARRE